MSDSQSNTPANPLRRTMNWFQRHHWVVGAALSVLILTLAGLAYGLWDQTQFLKSLNAHPGLEKAPGPRTAGAVAFQGVMWFWVASLLLFFPIQSAFRGIRASLRRKFKTRPPWNILFWPLIFSPEDVLPAPVWVAGRTAYGLFCIVVGLFMAANAIDAFVWERALPSGLSVCWVFLFIYGGVNYLLILVREQARMPIEPRQEGKCTSTLQARVFWWGIILSCSGAWVLSAAQTFTFSKAGLFPLAGGLLVGMSSALAMFMISRLSGSRLSGDLLEADSGWKRDTTGNLVVASGAGWKRVCRGMWRWLKGLARIAIAGLAIVILVIDACVALVMTFGNPSLNPNPSHDGDIFICGLVAGLLILCAIMKMRKPREPRLEDEPAPLSPEQLSPIHEAIFAGRTKGALKLYLSATGGRPDRRCADVLNFQKMAAELKQTQPEKFSAEALNGPNELERNAQIGKWLVWGSYFLVALFMLAQSWPSFGSFFGPLLGLLMVLGLGVLIRLLSSNKMAGWKWVYRSLFHVLKFAAWLIVALFVFVFACLIVTFTCGIFTLIAHPGALKELDLNSTLPFCVLSAGWLMAHLWLKWRKVP